MHVIGNNNKYVQLFDVIQKEDDVEIIKKKLGIKKANQLKDLKLYLYQLILKSLRIYNSEKSVALSLRNLTTDIETLYSKGLYAQSLELLEKAKRICDAYELYSQKLELLNLQKIIYQNYLTHDVNYAKRISEEDKETVQKLNTTLKYTWLASTVLSRLFREDFKIRDRTVLKQYAEIMKNPLMKSEDKAITIKSKNLFYDYNSHYYQSLGDYVKSYQHQEKRIRMLENNPHLVKELPIRLINALYRMIDICCYLKKYEEILFHISKLKALPFASPETKIRIMERSYYGELLYSIKTGKFQDEKKLDEIKLFLIENKAKISGFWKISLNYQLAIIYFILMDYKNASLHINNCLNDSYISKYIVLHMNVHFLNMIVYYEYDKHDLLEYTTRSVYRFLYKGQRLYKVEDTLLSFIRSSKKFNKTIDFKTGFIKLKKKLEELAKDPYESGAFQDFDYISWLDGKITNTSFIKIIQNNNQA